MAGFFLLHYCLPLVDCHVMTLIFYMGIGYEEFFSWNLSLDNFFPVVMILFGDILLRIMVVKDSL